jgi:hypothetical protein
MWLAKASTAVRIIAVATLPFLQRPCRNARHGSRSDETRTKAVLLDACSGAFMFLGIVLHPALPFTNEPWEISAPTKSITLSYVYHFIHAFRMHGFFVIDGYFLHLAWLAGQLRGGCVRD